MQIIITVVVIVLQLIAGQLLGFGLAMGLGVGNGWELLVIPLGNTLGVWVVGALAARLRGTFVLRRDGLRLLGAAVGSAIGVGLILLTPPWGFGQLLFPLLGALVGYYVAGALAQRPS
jgi:hypothetical protein